VDLRLFGSVLWRRKWIILAVTAVATGIAVAASLLTSPTYASTSTLRVAIAVNRLGDSVRFDDLQYADRLRNTYSDIAVSDPIVSKVVETLGLDHWPHISVDLPANSELMRFRVEDRDPAIAMRAANELASTFIAYVKTTGATGGDSAAALIRPQVAQAKEELTKAQQEYDRVATSAPGSPLVDTARRNLDIRQEAYSDLLQSLSAAEVGETIRANAVNVVNPAAEADSPFKPNTTVNIALGVVLGLIGGVALALVFENLDRRVYTDVQVEDLLGTPILAVIPSVKHPRRGVFNSGSPEEDAFRRLGAAIAGRARGTMMVVSADKGEGKSTIAANLASALARGSKSVVIVDANLRDPAVHEIFERPNRTGLSQALVGGTPLEEVIQSTPLPRLYMVPSGPAPSSPRELLGSKRMASLLTELERRFETVIIDTPAYLEVADAAILAPAVDSVLLVVEQGKAKRRDLDVMRDQLDTANVKTLGVVLNRAGSDAYADRGERRVASPAPTG
jgi:non-specific protein-tyrosine kinase